MGTTQVPAVDMTKLTPLSANSSLTLARRFHTGSRCSTTSMTWGTRSGRRRTSGSHWPRMERGWSLSPLQIISWKTIWIQ